MLSTIRATAILGAVASIGFAQGIKIQGKVTNASNQAIAGAKVELAIGKQSVTTGTDGTYNFSTVGVIPSRAGGVGSIMHLEQGALSLSVFTAAPVTVEIFDVQGNRIDRMTWDLASTGTYQIDLAGKGLTEKLHIVKATVGKVTQSFPYMPTGRAGDGMVHSLRMASQANSGTTGLAKVAATIDTLKVSATGYATKNLLVSSYDTTMNVVLDAASEDRWGGLKNPAAKSAGCGKAAGVTNGKKTITSSGRSRSYIIDIPTNYDMNKPYKFFYTSHWISSNAEAVVGQDYYFLKPLATAAGEPAIFLAPQALPGNPNGTWASGPPANANAHDSIDNVLFTDILKFVKQNLCIDTTRVFATGFSYGGMMTYSLSENRQNLIRAAVGIAPANFNIYVPPKTRQPIAWMQTTGMGDGTTPWACPASGGRCDPLIHGAKFIALGHAQDNGCTLPAGNNIPTTSSGAHMCYDFTGCKAGYPVKACTFNGGHTNIQNDPGSNVNWIPQESWKFFSQF